MTDNIQTIIEDNTTLYCVKDICDILNITNPSESIKKVDKRNIFIKSVKRKKATGKQLTNFVNIEGLKNIIFKSKSSKVKILINMLELSIDVVFPREEAHYISIIETSLDFYSNIKQYKIGSYYIDLYFPDYKIAIEVDEDNHKFRSKELEKQREDFIIKELNCKFIRFNPTVPLFNIGVIISQILKHIREYK
jgi:very-short-patch-repair endonuclease